jgi:hypothetical protein
LFFLSFSLSHVLIRQVLMLDADSIPLEPATSILHAFQHDSPVASANSNASSPLPFAPVSALGRVNKAMFWPDVTPLSTGVHEVREALGLNRLSGSPYSGATYRGAPDGGAPNEEALEFQESERSEQRGGAGGAGEASAETGQLVVVRASCLLALRAAWILNAHPVVYTVRSRGCSNNALTVLTLQ